MRKGNLETETILMAVVLAVGVILIYYLKTKIWG